MTTRPRFGGAARIVMVCGHDNVYDSPPPPIGDHGWCPHCDQFKIVIDSEPITLPSPALGYTKEVQLTHYSNVVRYRRHSHHGRKGS
jgi:hypothetical protein